MLHSSLASKSSNLRNGKRVQVEPNSSKCWPAVVDKGIDTQNKNTAKTAGG